MKTRLLFSALLLLGLGGTTQGVQVTRYVSPWTLVPAGQIVNFSHTFDARPLEVDVWIAYPVNAPNKVQCQASFENVYSIYETDALRLQNVNPFLITVKNEGDTLYCVQVVASP